LFYHIITKLPYSVNMSCKMPQEKLDENKNINPNVNAAYKSKRYFLN